MVVCTTWFSSNLFSRTFYQFTVLFTVFGPYCTGFLHPFPRTSRQPRGTATSPWGAGLQAFDSRIRAPHFIERLHAGSNACTNEESVVSEQHLAAWALVVDCLVLQNGRRRCRSQVTVRLCLVVCQLRATAAVGMNRSVCNRKTTSAHEYQEESIADVAIKTISMFPFMIDRNCDFVLYGLTEVEQCSERLNM